MKSLPKKIEKILKVSDGTRINYELCTIKKAKKFIVLLHGLGGDLTAWDSERVTLNALGYSTLSIDLRGHGLSDHPNSESSYSLERFAQDVFEIITKEKLDNFVLVGHCFGGMVAIFFAATYQKFPKALILVDTSYKPPFKSPIPLDNKILKKIFLLIVSHAPNHAVHKHADFSKFRDTKDIDINRFISDILHTSIKSYLLIFEKILSLNASSLLSKIEAPTLIVEGTNDSIFPPDVAKDLSERIVRSKISFIPRANHIIVINNPQDLVDSMYSFLRKIPYSP